MLTRQETLATKAEPAENFNRLGYDFAQVAKDLEISQEELKAVLAMFYPDPAHVWMLRDYLEDMLLAQGKEVYPFSKLANRSANRWFSYERPWRHHRKG